MSLRRVHLCRILELVWREQARPAATPPMHFTGIAGRSSSFVRKQGTGISRFGKERPAGLPLPARKASPHPDYEQQHKSCAHQQWNRVHHRPFRPGAVSERAC
jgi:hypothetical protein